MVTERSTRGAAGAARPARKNPRRERSTVTTVPGLPEVAAAWHSLPPETRDRIGIIAVDMVFQAFVHGDAYVATGSPKDRAVPGRSKAAHAIRDAAGEAETVRLNELHRVVEGLIPDLFGPAGQNPEWAVALGALR